MLIVIDGGATIDAFPSSASLFKSVSIAPGVPPEHGSRYCFPPLVTVLQQTKAIKETLLKANEIALNLLGSKWTLHLP